MPSVKALIHQNINRARHSLPYLDQFTKDMIAMLVPLHSYREPACGIYGHATCSEAEYKLLTKYVAQRPEISINRLPDRVYIESLIVLPTPSIASRRGCALNIVAIPTRDAPIKKIEDKYAIMAQFMRKQGITLNYHCSRDLPQRLILRVMQSGIVLAGKHPVTNEAEISESSVFIGELPVKISDSRTISTNEWDPFSTYLENRITEMIEAGEYAVRTSREGLSPYLINYLPLIDYFEGLLDVSDLDKLRTAIYTLHKSFGPTRDAIDELAGAWNFKPSKLSYRDMDLTQALKVRRYLVSQQEDELPIALWPPSPQSILFETRLVKNKGLWMLKELPEFSHRHAWVVLAWATLTGHITTKTKIIHSGAISLRHDATRSLRDMYDELLSGTRLIVPDDHMQGSIYMQDGRFNYSDKPFAALSSERKCFLAVEEQVKKKAIIDDKGLEKFIKDKT